MSTGYINWQRLGRIWHDTGEGSTFVYAFWPAEQDHHREDSGISLFKPRGKHPDWFVFADGAETVLNSAVHESWVVSPNVSEVYIEPEEAEFSNRPVLAAICLGTVNAIYASRSRSAYWWCGHGDLTWQGKTLIRSISALYERPPVLLTYLARAQVPVGAARAA